MSPVQYPPIPSFSPEHFAVARGADPSKHKQFRRGIEQLEQEGVVQVLRSDRRGDQAPVLAAVGPMQFEVAVHRMATELSAPISLESLPYQVARIVDPADAEFMSKQVSVGSPDPHRRSHARAVLHPVAAGGLPTGQPRREAGVVGGGGGIARCGAASRRIPTAARPTRAARCRPPARGAQASISGSTETIEHRLPSPHPSTPRRSIVDVLRQGAQADSRATTYRMDYDVGDSRSAPTVDHQLATTGNRFAARRPSVLGGRRVIVDHRGRGRNYPLSLRVRVTPSPRGSTTDAARITSHQVTTSGAPLRTFAVRSSRSIESAHVGRCSTNSRSATK